MNPPPGSEPSGSPDADGVAAVRRFDESPSSVAAARRFVVDALGSWDCAELAPDAAICVSELATNAILHSRGPFDVAVRRLSAGVGIDVIDQRPEELPTMVPATGTAADITRRAITGRGLRIVSSVSRRWGFTTSASGKAVWAEVSGDQPGESTEPVVVHGHLPEPLPDALVLEMRSLPVRPAVASGVQVDDLVRSLQLGTRAASTDPSAIARLHELLDESAPIRLGGRYAALRAAARSEHRFDLTIQASLDAFRAVSELTMLLHELAPYPVDPEVQAFRQWLLDESLRQLSGEAPTTCPLP